MKKIALTAALVAAACQTTAFAQDRLPDVRVRYGDLDLTQPGDLARLDTRLERAVRDACPDARVPGHLTLSPAAAQCRAAKRAEIAPLRQAALAAAEAGNTTFATAR